VRPYVCDVSFGVNIGSENEVVTHPSPDLSILRSLVAYYFWFSVITGCDSQNTLISAPLGPCYTGKFLSRVELVSIKGHRSLSIDSDTKQQA